jgi:hypothetical protein
VKNFFSKKFDHTVETGFKNDTTGEILVEILWVSPACFCLLVFAILSHENVHRFEIIMGRQSIIILLLKTHVTQNWFNPGTKKEEKKRGKNLPIATNYKKYKEK